MNTVLGDILPYAATIAISPIPIIATILMLMSPRARSLGLGFLSGWVLGIAMAVTAFTLLAGLLPAADSTSSQPLLGVIQLLLGAGLLFLAAKQWRSRPRPGEEAELPRWMAAIDTMKPRAAFGLAFLLAAVNPKNLLVAVAAGTSIAHAQLPTGTIVATIGVFVVLAALSVLVPVLAYLLAPQKAAVVLESVRGWLTANNATIMAVVLLMLGIQLLGKGIGSF